MDKRKDDMSKVITADELLNRIADGMGYDREFTFTELEDALDAMKAEAV